MKVILILRDLILLPKNSDNYLVAKKVFISLGDKKQKGIGLIDTRKIGDIQYCEDGVSFLWR